MSKSSGGLTRWFSENWVDLSRPKKGGGFEPCGRDDAKSGKYPKCVPAARAARMTPEQIESAIRRKRMAESRESREGKKPIMVPTIQKVGDKPGHPFRGNQYTKASQHARAIDKRLRAEHGDKVADTWKPLVSEAMKRWYGQSDMNAPIEIKGKRIFVGGKEISAMNVLDVMADALGVEAISLGETFGEGSLSKAESKNVPDDPELYARVKAEAKKKFDVYPSAYANGWLVAEYKRRGGKYKVEKHLSGKHDQRSHGKKGSARGAKPAVMQALALDGGFTYNPRRGEFRRKGIAVAIAKEHEVSFSEADFARDGARYIKEYMAQKGELLAQPEVHVGAWKFAGRIFLDLSIVKPSLTEAADLGRSNDQIGIFDLASFQTWGRISPGGKYFPQQTRKMSGREMTYLELTDLSIGKAEERSGVIFVPAIELLDDSAIENFVKEILNLKTSNEKKSVKKESPTSTDVHVPTIMGNARAVNERKRKLRKKKMAMEAALSKKQPLKDPKGGLTAAGRKHFNRTSGSNLKPGVRGPADTPEKMRRKGSFLTRFFTNPSGPMVGDNGKPTRLALSAAAWGEPVPKNRSDAAKLAEKGRNLLERYENTKNVNKAGDKPGHPFRGNQWTTDVTKHARHNQASHGKKARGGAPKKKAPSKKAPAKKAPAKKAPVKRAKAPTRSGQPQLKTRIVPVDKASAAKAKKVKEYMTKPAKNLKKANHRAYALARVEQMTSGTARPKGMSKKYRLSREEVVRLEIVLSRILRAGREKYEI